MLPTQRRHRRDDQIDPQHWAGLPDGSGRSTTTSREPVAQSSTAASTTSTEQEPEQLAVVLAHRTKLATPVARRDMAVYDAAAGLSTGLTTDQVAVGAAR